MDSATMTEYKTKQPCWRYSLNVKNALNEECENSLLFADRVSRLMYNYTQHSFQAYVTLWRYAAAT